MTPIVEKLCYKYVLLQGKPESKILKVKTDKLKGHYYFTKNFYYSVNYSLQYSLSSKFPMHLRSDSTCKQLIVMQFQQHIYWGNQGARIFFLWLAIMSSVISLGVCQSTHDLGQFMAFSQVVKYVNVVAFTEQNVEPELYRQNREGGPWAGAAGPFMSETAAGYCFPSCQPHLLAHFFFLMDSIHFITKVY